MVLVAVAAMLRQMWFADANDWEPIKELAKHLGHLEPIAKLVAAFAVGFRVWVAAERMRAN